MTVNSSGIVPNVVIVDRAEAILRRMNELHQSGSLLGVMPGTESYLAVLLCWADTGSDEAGQRAMSIFEEAKAAEKQSGEKILNPIFYRGVLQAFASAGDAKNAESVLAEFHRQYYQEGNKDAKPTVYNLSIILNAWAKSNDPSAPERAETILRETEKLYDEGVLDSPPNTISYTSVVECYAKSSLPNATERAQAILDEMICRAKKGEVHVRPSDLTYRNVMATYASRGMVKETEDVLYSMFEAYEKGNLDARPTARAMNLALSALSKSKDPDGGVKAVAYLKRMEQLYSNQKLDGRPDVVSYTLALKCISNSSRKDGGEQAEELLNEMESRASQGETFLSPNTLTYSTVIQIYGRSGRPDKAEALLERMYSKHLEGCADIEPNTRTFTSVLQAWSRSDLHGSTERALVILERMKELHEKGVLNDVKPNFFTYSAVLGAMATSNRKEDCQRALELLEEMEELSKEDPEVAPNDFAWNNALRTFANVGDGMKAQEAIARMYHKYESGVLSSKPNIVSWQHVVEAWSKSEDPNSASRVLAILKRMQELCEDGILDDRPSAHIYLAALECFSKRNHSEFQKQIGPILDELEALALSGETQQSLSMFDHLRIIRALIRLKNEDILAKAEVFLRRMLNYDRRSSQWNPNAVRASFTALIAAWSKSRGKQAVRHSVRLQQELESLKLRHYREA